MVTNDIYTAEDAQFLVRNEALAPSASSASRPAAAPHRDPRGRLDQPEAVDRPDPPVPRCRLIFVESGGDNLAATFAGAVGLTST